MCIRDRLKVRTNTGLTRFHYELAPTSHKRYYTSFRTFLEIVKFCRVCMCAIFVVACVIREITLKYIDKLKQNT